jgi:electron transfer flavoprotein alpha/beta subunit
LFLEYNTRWPPFRQVENIGVNTALRLKIKKTTQERVAVEVGEERAEEKLKT